MKLKSYFKSITLLFFLSFLLFAAAIFLFVEIVEEVIWEKEVAFDNFVLNFVGNHLTTPTLTSVMKVVTDFASSTFLQIAYSIIILIYLFRKRFRTAFEIFAVGLGGSLITNYMKVFFERSRPDEPLVSKLESFSFPSGHATSGFIFFGLLAYIFWKLPVKKIYKYIIVFLCIAFAFLIGFSRIYLRVHYPTDVIAGISIGFAWLLLTINIMERMKRKNIVREN